MSSDDHLQPLALFVPFRGKEGGPDSPALLRIAAAAEYAAAQLGVIARSVAEIESHLDKIAGRHRVDAQERRKP